MLGSATCHTECLAQPLTRALRALGALVGTHPWPFLLLPLVLSGSLGSGFVFLHSRQNHELESQFTPLGGPAKADRRFIQEHFPTNDAERFSAPRLTTLGTFAILLAVAVNATVLTPVAFAELLALDQAVKGLHTTDRTFAQLCARNYGRCSSPNPLLSAVQGNPGRVKDLMPNLNWPLGFGGHVFLAPFLGGVVLDPEGNILAAKALRLLYYLQEDDPLQREASELWLKSFMEHIPDVLGSLNLSSIQVAYFTSLSRQEEFEKNIEAVIPLFSATYILTILFSIIACARLDCVRTKVWVAVFGVFSSGLSVLSSFGLLLFCGVPYVITVSGAPFLILGIGIDDMFILVSCWEQTKVKDSVKDRMADTYAEAALSVTLTTLTDILAFYIGIETPFQSVRSFCIYTGTAFVFCYVYNLTFLGAILALNGRREESNRHWLTFMKVETEPQASRGCAHNRCCVGGSFDESTGAEIEHPMNGFFRKHYGPFLMHPCIKALVVILYLLYLASSIYGCIFINQGIDVRNLANDNSYVIQYYDWEEKYFSEYGPRVMVVVTQSIEYWNSSVSEDLENCMASLENSTYVDIELSEAWFRIYETTIFEFEPDKNFYIGNLPDLFNITPESQWDIKFSATEISASRFYIQTINVTTAVDESNVLSELRCLAKNCKIPVIVYHPAFIYFDQYHAIIHNAILNVVVAAAAMLIISLLLVPNPLCSLWFTFAIASVIVGVTGFMTYWDINLDSISMIDLIICTGYSVDFSAHISYAFISSKESKMNDKAVEALYRVGYPIFQGALSTAMGVVVLSASFTYIFRTFSKIMFLVILFGAVHGLIFIPVFLTLFGCPGLQKIRAPAVEKSSEKLYPVNVVTPQLPTLEENPS
ncbi:hypothetical protein lerEdw1_020494 [Lerista edwardsae]|nr:hypothetical protein lerEdw1_020494 [Lerista edwardsae]